MFDTEKYTEEEEFWEDVDNTDFSEIDDICVVYNAIMCDNNFNAADMAARFDEDTVYNAALILGMTAPIPDGIELGDMVDAINERCDGVKRLNHWVAIGSRQWYQKSLINSYSAPSSRYYQYPLIKSAIEYADQRRSQSAGPSPQQMSVNYVDPVNNGNNTKFGNIFWKAIHERPTSPGNEGMFTFGKLSQGTERNGIECNQRQQIYEIEQLDTSQFSEYDKWHIQQAKWHMEQADKCLEGPDGSFIYSCLHMDQSNWHIEYATQKTEPVTSYYPPSELTSIHVDWHMEQANWHMEQANWHMEQANWHMEQANWHKQQANWHKQQANWHKQQANWTRQCIPNFNKCTEKKH